MAVKRKVEVLKTSEERVRTRSTRHTRSQNVEETQKAGELSVKVEDALDEDEAIKTSSEEEDLEDERRKYEEERNRILEENRKRMQELGLPDLSKHLSSTHRTQANLKSANAAIKKRNTVKHQVEIGFQPRRSARAEGIKASYRVKEEPREAVPRRCTSKPRPTSGKLEVYTEEHVKLLGSYKNEWILFRDGVAPGGGRVYDPVTGKTCHQCRQKTLGRRTWCNLCKSLSGQFCGDCLFMRYGENVLETHTNKNWVCPGCRGICNCSICRVRRGWAPTGNLFRYAIGEGFRSVAHYLIMTRQRQPACEGEEIHRGETSGVNHLVDSSVQQKDTNDSIIQPETPSPIQRTSQYVCKIEASGVFDATVAELQHNDALRLKKEIPLLESENFVNVKVEIPLANNQDEVKGGSTSTFKIKEEQEEWKGPNQGASELLQNARNKRKEVAGTYQSSLEVSKSGGMHNVVMMPENKRLITAEYGVPCPGDHSLKSECPGLDEGSVAVKERSSSSTKVGVVCENSKACYEEALTLQAPETSAEHEKPGKKLTGRTKMEIARQRLTLKETSHLSGTLACRVESTCTRLRRKEAISYKAFL